MAKSDKIVWLMENGKFLRAKKTYTIKELCNFIINSERLHRQINCQVKDNWESGKKIQTVKIMPFRHDTDNTLKVFKEYEEFSIDKSSLYYSLSSEEREKYRDKSIWYEYVYCADHKSTREESFEKRAEIIGTPKKIWDEILDGIENNISAISFDKLGQKWQWGSPCNIEAFKGNVTVTVDKEYKENILRIFDAVGKIDTSRVLPKSLELKDCKIQELLIGISIREVKTNTSSFLTNDGTSEVRFNNCEINDTKFFKKFCGKNQVGELEIKESKIPEGDLNIESSVMITNTNAENVNIKCSDIKIGSFYNGVKDGTTKLGVIKAYKIDIEEDCRIKEMSLLTQNNVEVGKTHEKAVDVRINKMSKVWEFEVINGNVVVGEMEKVHRLHIRHYKGTKQHFEKIDQPKDMDIMLFIPSSEKKMLTKEEKKLLDGSYLRNVKFADYDKRLRDIGIYIDKTYNGDFTICFSV